MSDGTAITDAMNTIAGNGGQQSNAANTGGTQTGNGGQQASQGASAKVDFTPEQQTKIQELIDEAYKRAYAKAAEKGSESGRGDGKKKVDDSDLIKQMEATRAQLSKMNE